MLLRFTCENFLSFRDEVCLNMIASPEKGHDNHVIDSTEGPNVRILRAGAIYGANASGKSNLVLAMFFARELIVGGTDPEDLLQVEPFQLDENSSSSPTRMEFQVKTDGRVFDYGLVMTARQIVEEWLYVKGAGREAKWFVRQVDEKGDSVFDFGAQMASNSKDRQFLEFLGRGTRSNQPFLTEGAERNFEKMMPLYLWFRNVLQIVLPDAEYRPLLFRASKDRRFVDFLGQLLKMANTGVESIAWDPIDIPQEQLLEALPAEASKRLKKALSDNETFFVGRIGEEEILVSSADGKIQAHSLRAVHKVSGDKNRQVRFDLRSESDGTRRLVHLAPALLDLGSQERVYVMDEMDRSLHPKLSRLFVHLFLNMTPIQESQLVFTTHESHLLDQDLLRRDEVWFTEKSKEGGSRLYSLAEFNIRRDLKLEKGYLRGRFGGVPLFDEDSPSTILSSCGEQDEADEHGVA